MTAPPGDELSAEVVVDQLAERFCDLTGEVAEGVWRSPGRVNLIGEHTDYNDGLALPFAIDRATFVAARRRPDRVVRILSSTLESQVSADIREVGGWQASGFKAWARYPLGVVWAMNQRGAVTPGFDMVVSSTLPMGGGLSSSAALTVSVGVALNEMTGAGFATIELARISQQAESVFAGVPCGLMDQVAVLEGKSGYAVLIDFSSLTTQLVPVDVGPLVIINTRVERTNSSGAYADRRAACEKAAEILGVGSLRQATLDQVEARLDGELRKRARHVVTENTRVSEVALRLRNHEPIGDLLVASHVSLRDDYEVSCPELDLAVGTALANGTQGARLTGAGFGGCAISIGAIAEDLSAPLKRAFAAAGFREPEVFAVAPSDGAGRFDWG